MMKLCIFLTFLTVIQLSYAMERRVTRQALRVQQEIDFNDGSRITQYLETGYSEDGTTFHISHHSNSIKAILWQNFAQSKKALVGGSLLIFTFLTGVNAVSRSRSQSPWFNQTSICPAIDYCALREKDAFVNGAVVCAGAMGGILCLCQCFKTCNQCCDC